MISLLFHIVLAVTVSGGSKMSGESASGGAGSGQGSQPDVRTTSGTLGACHYLNGALTQSQPIRFSEPILGTFRVYVNIDDPNAGGALQVLRFDSSGRISETMNLAITSIEGSNPALIYSNGSAIHCTDCVLRYYSDAPSPADPSGTEFCANAIFGEPSVRTGNFSDQGSQNSVRVIGDQPGQPGSGNSGDSAQMSMGGCGLSPKSQAPSLIFASLMILMAALFRLFRLNQRK